MLFLKLFLIIVLVTSCVSFKLQEPDIFFDNLETPEGSDYEIVYLPTISSDDEREEIFYDFSMFGR